MAAISTGVNTAMIAIEISTLFDITDTNVKHHYKPTLIPFVSRNGENITDELSWQKARNQQRNWDTINQIISLRTLPENVTSPVRNKKQWQFEFSVNSIEQLETEENQLDLLKQDCENVPLIIGLDEENVKNSVLRTGGQDQNIWFKVISTTK